MAGIKYDQEKNLLQLLPVYPLWEIGRVYSYGAEKYTEDNWRGGMKWTRIYGAILRHLLKWVSGKNLDEESGLPHLAHAAFGLLTLLEYSQTHVELDDRPKSQGQISVDTETSRAAKVETKVGNPPFLSPEEVESGTNQFERTEAATVLKETEEDALLAYLQQSDLFLLESPLQEDCPCLHLRLPFVYVCGLCSRKHRPIGFYKSPSK